MHSPGRSGRAEPRGREARSPGRARGRWDRRAALVADPTTRAGGSRWTRPPRVWTPHRPSGSPSGRPPRLADLLLAGWSDHRAHPVRNGRCGPRPDHRHPRLVMRFHGQGRGQRPPYRLGRSRPRLPGGRCPQRQRDGTQARRVPHRRSGAFRIWTVRPRTPIGAWSDGERSRTPTLTRRAGYRCRGHQDQRLAMATPGRCARSETTTSPSPRAGQGLRGSASWWTAVRPRPDVPANAPTRAGACPA